MNEELKDSNTKNVALISVGDRFKFQAGGWWALVFGSFIFLLCFIFWTTKILLDYNVKMQQLSICPHCGHQLTVDKVSIENIKKASQK